MEKTKTADVGYNSWFVEKQGNNAKSYNWRRGRG
jgi:hypothetical protein